MYKSIQNYIIIAIIFMFLRLFIPEYDDYYFIIINFIKCLANEP